MIGILYAPSIKNTKMGLLSIDPTDYTVTDLTMDNTADTDYRIVYKLKDGTVITANNDKAVLFY